MGSVILNNLKNNDKVSPDYTYVDLHLDLAEAVVPTDASERAPISKDIKVDLDEAAIRNSIINIFNTIPGERFLVPEFGANLRKYLFRAVTEATANVIGRTVLDAIELWEPRVTVDRVNVIARPIGTISFKGTDKFANITRLQEPAREDEYIVEVIISLPALKHKISLTCVLTQNGFAEISTT